MSPDPFGLVGSVLEGRYRVERVAGEGGFGVVYKAFHVGFEAPVAVKVLKLPSSATQEQREVFLRAFRAEGKLLFELSSLHDSIVQATETGTVVSRDGKVAPYLVLEWLDGVCLERELRERHSRFADPFTLPESLSLLTPAARALSIAHRRGIAHRDIKPGNLFLAAKDGRVVPKILDFGLAKIAIETGNTTAMFAQTSDLRLPFTPAYGAPEQFNCRLGATGPWTDTYALALVLVEMLSGQRALVGSDPAQYMGATTDGHVRPTPRARGTELGDAVEEVFLRALQIEPRERFREAGAFWDALCEAAGWSPSAEHAPPQLLAIPGAASDRAEVSKQRQSNARATTGSTLPGTTSMALGSPASEPSRGGRSRRTMVLVTVASAAVLGFGLLVSRSHRVPNPSQPATQPTPTQPAQSPSHRLEDTQPAIAVSPSSPLAAGLLASAAPSPVRPSPPARRVALPSGSQRESKPAAPPAEPAPPTSSLPPAPSNGEVKPEEVLGERR